MMQLQRDHLRALLELARRAPMSLTERIFLDGMTVICQEAWQAEDQRRQTPPPQTESEPNG